MKPSKVRLARRRSHARMLAWGNSLEEAAIAFVNGMNNPNMPSVEQRRRRSLLFASAIDFAAAVDGESQVEAQPAIRAVKP